MLTWREGREIAAADNLRGGGGENVTTLTDGGVMEKLAMSTDEGVSGLE